MGSRFRLLGNRTSVLLPLDRPSRRRPWGTLYSCAPGYSVKQSYCGHTPWLPPDTRAAAPCRDRVSAGRHGPLCPGQGSQHASHCCPAQPGSADIAETYPIIRAQHAARSVAPHRAVGFLWPIMWQIVRCGSRYRKSRLDRGR